MARSTGQHLHKDLSVEHNEQRRISGWTRKDASRRSWSVRLQVSRDYKQKWIYCSTSCQKCLWTVSNYSIRFFFSKKRQFNFHLTSVSFLFLFIHLKSLLCDNERQKKNKSEITFNTSTHDKNMILWMRNGNCRQMWCDSRNKRWNRSKWKLFRFISMTLWFL